MKFIRRVLPTTVAAVLSASIALTASAQQKVPFSMGVHVAPTGIADQPLKEGPFTYHTAEQQDIKVSVFVKGLEYPYSLAFLPTGEMLVTERAGRLRVIRNGKLDPKPVEGGPASRWS